MGVLLGVSNSSCESSEVSDTSHDTLKIEI